MRTVLLLAVGACLVALGCSTAEAEEDWTHAQVYIECFYGAYQTESLTLSAFDEALLSARKQCHVPPRGAIKSLEERHMDCIEGEEEPTERCSSEATGIVECYQKANALMGKYKLLPDLKAHQTVLRNVCSPDSKYRLDKHLDGSEAG